MKKFFLMTMSFALLVVLTSCKANETTTQGTITRPADLCSAEGYDYVQEELVYNLKWSDEFDSDHLDETKWSYETGGNGWGNNELQYYTKGDNVTVQDGILTIEARKDTENEYLNDDYTSSRIVTRNKGDWRYGKFEIRAKLPEGRGTWPAIWMMPTSSSYGTWPRSGEIDIMEHVGYEMNKIHGSIHTHLYNHKKGTQKGGSIDIDNVSTEFHVYSIEWLPDKIDYFVDGEKYYTFQPSKLVGCPNKDHWPFDKSFFLILNIAVGGDWGGVRGVDENIWPQTMEVDYVRVYQSDEITNLEQK
jgi:beta-glucanase (GH16 family)